MWNVVETHFQIVLANAQHIKAVPRTQDGHEGLSVDRGTLKTRTACQETVRSCRLDVGSPQLFLHRYHELLGPDVDSNDELRQNVAPDYERDRKLEAGATLDSIFAKFIEYECVAAQL